MNDEGALDPVEGLLDPLNPTEKTLHNSSLILHNFKLAGVAPPLAKEEFQAGDVFTRGAD
jgi:hypothetical protein